MALTGVGMSTIGRKLMVAPLSLTVEAIRRAVADAGLSIDEIDGLSTYPASAPKAAMPKAASVQSNRSWASSPLGTTVGMRPQAPPVPLSWPCWRWRPDYAAMWCAFARSGSQRPQIWLDEARRPRHRDRGHVSGADEHLAPFGAQAVQTVAMAASQHMARYGTTRETLGWIALNARANAALNPTAIYRDPLTMDDYMGARPISFTLRPLRLRCSL